MSSVEPAIDYTSRDWATINEALTAHIKAKFPSSWKDFTVSSMGQAIMDLVAYAFDSLSFAIDYTANEMYLETARDRHSILLLGRLLGYQLRTPASAAVICVATLPGSVVNPVIVSTGTAVKSVTDGIDFITVSGVTLQPGVPGSITFVQGVNRIDNFVSDGSIFQKFTLAQSTVVEDTVTILVDGDTWTEVASLAYAGTDDKMFVVEYDEDGIGYIMFGNGTSGKIPSNAADIQVSYRTGGGIQGNIALSEISTTVIGKEQTAGFPDVSVTIINSEDRGAGGEDAETISHAKLWIPRWVKANSRAVTEEDYDALASVFSDPTYGAPAFVKAALKQEIPELNTVLLYAWARDGAGDIVVPSTGLKNALSTYFNNIGAGAVRMMCQHCEVLDGEIMYVDVAVGIKVATDYVLSDVTEAVTSAVENIFDATDLIPGDDFRISVLYNTIQSVAGVEYCIITTLRGSYKTTEVIGIGDAVETNFSSTLTLEPGLDVVPNSITVTYGSPATETIIDDGNGNLIDSEGENAGSIDYETGDISVTFAAAPPVDSLVNVVEFKHILDYQRGEVEATGDGSTRRFKGVVEFPPVNPYDAATGFKGIAFAAEGQVVTDDGDGNLIGDVDPTGQNVIDYDTGGYDFTFVLAPADGAEVRSAYKQILETASKDLPLLKSQLPAEGQIIITTL